MLKKTEAPAVLVEYGFMDSSTDVPVILTDGYAKAMAYATMDAIAYRAGLTLAAPSGKAQVQVLRRGDKGETVRAMQALLTLRGFACDTDGSFGPATQKQLEAFQSARRLTVNSICADETWGALLGVEA